MYDLFYVLGKLGELMSILRVRLCKSVGERELDYSQNFYFPTSYKTSKASLLEFKNFMEDNGSLFGKYDEIAEYELIELIQRNDCK